MSSAAGGRRAFSAVLEVAWWWGAAVGIWLLTLSSVTFPDLIAAIGCGLPCGLAARAGRHAMRAAWRPRLGWVRWLAPLPAQIVTDSARVLAVAVRGLGGDRDPGELREIRLAAGEDPAARSAHQALAGLMLSLTPGTFVLESDPEENIVVVHSLASGWPDLDQAVSR
jgi:multisubunit Na+/H+ antiporter MnhE subunit